MGITLESLFLFALLSSPDYQTRQAAPLASAGGVSLLALQCSKDLEVRAAAANEVFRRRDWLAERLKDEGSLPWITALPPLLRDRNAIIEEWVNTARQQGGWEVIGQWNHEKLATRLFLQSLPPDQARSLLRRMPVGMWWTRPQFSENEGGLNEPEGEGWNFLILTLNEWGDPQWEAVAIRK